MSRPALLQKIISFLRSGYPEGVPEHDYQPLFALLSLHLSDEEVAEVVADLGTAALPYSTEVVREAIARVSKEPPLEADVARVQARLAAGGWPLAPISELD